MADSEVAKAIDTFRFIFVVEMSLLFIVLGTAAAAIVKELRNGKRNS